MFSQLLCDRKMLEMDTCMHGNLGASHSQHANCKKLPHGDQHFYILYFVFIFSKAILNLKQDSVP